MKLMTFAAMLAVIASPVAAETHLEQWQTDALEKVREYGRVKDAAWQSPTLLYLFANDADVAWDTIADQVSCNHLRDVGMPSERHVMIAFYDNVAAIDGAAKRLGYARCK